MPEAYEDEIRTRAYKLWEDAGKPDFGMDDFWLEAEQQISGAAQKSDLSERAKANTTDMLTKLFNRLGYQQVTITYRDAPQ